MLRRAVLLAGSDGNCHATVFFTALLSWEIKMSTLTPAVHPIESMSCAPAPLPRTASNIGSASATPITGSQTSASPPPQLSNELWSLIGGCLDQKHNFYTGNPLGPSLANLRLALGKKRLPATALPHMCTAIASRYASKIFFGGSAHEMLLQSPEAAGCLTACRALRLYRPNGCKRYNSFFARMSLDREQVAHDLAFVLRQATNVRDLSVYLCDAAPRAFDDDDAEEFDVSLQNIWERLLEDRKLPVIDGAPYPPYVPLFATLATQKMLTSLKLTMFDWLDGPDLVPLEALCCIERLTISECFNLFELPDAIWHLPKLRCLDLSIVNLTSIAPSVRHARALVNLSLCEIHRFAPDLPKELFSLPNLRELELYDVTQEGRVALRLTNFGKVHRLHLVNMRLRHVPEAAAALADHLTELDLRRNTLDGLPAWLLTCPKLTRVTVRPDVLERAVPAFSPLVTRGILVALADNEWP